MEQTNLDLIIVEEILLMDCLSLDIILSYYFFFHLYRYFWTIDLEMRYTSLSVLVPTEQPH